MTPADTEAPKHGPIARLIAASARNPLLTLLLTLALAAWAAFALHGTKLDAVPDLSDTQVIIFTEWMGRSPDLVEDQITYPVSSALLAAPRVKAVRGQSMFGMSFVYVIFEDGTDLYWARSRVLEYLNTAQGKLPQGVTPTLGPDATGVGWVFEYALRDRSGRHGLAELRSLQDWNVRYALSSVPGVAEVASLGGMVRQYQVQVDPQRLRAQGLMLSDVARAVRASNGDVGGRVLELAGHEHVVRGRGYVKSVADLENVPLKVGSGGAPVLVKHVGTVSLGPDLRRGVAELDGEGEVAGGVVVMRYGENALQVIERVKARLEEVKRSLPEGVELVVTYDRSGLIQESVHTLTRAMVEELLVVSLIIFLFLLHVRSALVPILTLPVAVLLAFLPMYYQGLTANIMSLGGIVVAVGAMVDASIILIENVHKRLEEWEESGRPGARREVIISAMQEVGPSIFGSLLVLTVAFIPVFTLESTEGRLFKPLAYTKTWSMGFAAVLAVTLTPALAALFIRGRIRREDENPVNRLLIRLYTPVVRWVVRHPRRVVAFSLLAMVFTVPAFLRLGNEFMPPLNEGAILYMPTAPPGMSVTEAARVLRSMDAELKRIPEVVSVFGKAGRAESPTDPAPPSMFETTVVLKPRGEWRPGLTWEGLLREMDERLQYPGMPNIFWMPIQTRTEMLATGIRSPLGIQVYGDSLQDIERAAVAVERAVAQVPGTRSAFADRATGGLYLDVTVKREEAARLGLSVEDVNEVVSGAIGGETVSQTVEGRERYPINVRYAREYRDTPAALGEALVATPSGAQVPLSQVAEVKSVQGPPMLRSEGGKLLTSVFVDTERPIADYVQEARAAVEREVKLPSGVRLEWSGQFTYFERAKERLRLVVPATLLLVVLLLYLSTRSWAETAIVMLAVPFSLIGAVWLLYLLGYNMSVAVWVGLIALAGLDAETGVIMLLYLTLAHGKASAEGRMRSAADLEAAILVGAAQRIRPKLMTVAVDMIGLLPVLWATGTGSDVMKRITAPLVGGLVTSFLLELTVYPAVFALWKRRGLARESAAAEEAVPAIPRP
ncbi:efflux RND transporter permease subunit [Aggregicoccus sp. 17bor-14]|uniref:efflux RND transporter permease subunit n=1 Tax=Myxococcaceae TaxID=31 RepID=UPI00129C57D5|nr:MULTISPECIES: CusA/CzcA family heavy metal efflux RND transporter [Myxococcaceae]MBF5046472.1 efflux RND transporter permease subunit [Simulacricoccus sp. 17bor-14]MRI92189.1 efflux RND transporter permease subunit [Aggregicoccus sp. 17bor-14]